MARPLNSFTALGVLTLLVGVSFAGALGNDFVYDDRELVRNNAALETLRPGDHLGRGFWPGADRNYPYYRPLTSWSLALNNALHGESATGYHLANLLVHLGCGVLLFLVLSLVAGARLGLVAAALFAVHPIQTEAVAWVVGRADLLATFFLLLALVAHAKVPDRPSRASLTLGAGAGIAFLAALLSKEQALTFPALVLAFELARAIVGEGSWRERLRPAAARLRVTAPLYLAAIAGYLVLRHQIVGPLLAMPDESLWKNPLLGAPFVTRWLTAVNIGGRYLLLLVFPKSLSVDYYFDVVPLVRSVSSTAFLLPAVAIAATAAAIWAGRRSPAVTFGAVTAFATYLPLSHLLFAAPVVMAERVLYLPMVGLAACIATLVVALATRLAPRKGSIAVVLLSLVLLVPSILRTRDRTADWRDDLTLFSSAVEAQPRSALSWNNLASVQLESDDPAAAEQSARRALEILPGYLAANGNLADALRRQGRLDESERILRKALLDAPEAEDTLWLNLVQLITLRAARLEDSGQADLARALRGEAVEQARRRLLHIRAGRPAAVYQLALAQNLWGLARHDEAEQAFAAALRITGPNERPEPEMLDVRVTVLDATAAWRLQRGQPDEAAASWVAAAAAAELHGVPTRAADLLLRAAQVRHGMGQRSAAIDLVRRAEPLGRGDPAVERRVRSALTALQGPE